MFDAQGRLLSGWSAGERGGGGGRRGVGDWAAVLGRGWVCSSLVTGQLQWQQRGVGRTGGW